MLGLGDQEKWFLCSKLHGLRLLILTLEMGGTDREPGPHPSRTPGLAGKNNAGHG